jgi:hypothetical protein
MARTLDDWRRALQSPEALAALMKEEARAKDDLQKAQDALADYDANGGLTVEELKAELGLADDLK